MNNNNHSWQNAGEWPVSSSYQYNQSQPTDKNNTNLNLPEYQNNSNNSTKQETYDSKASQNNAKYGDMDFK